MVMHVGINSIFGTAKATQEADTVIILQRPAEDESLQQEVEGERRQDGEEGKRSARAESFKGGHGFQVTIGTSGRRHQATTVAPSRRAVTEVSTVQRNTYLDVKKNRYDGTLGTVRLKFLPTSMSFQEVKE